MARVWSGQEVTLTLFSPSFLVLLLLTGAVLGPGALFSFLLRVEMESSKSSQRPYQGSGWHRAPSLLGAPVGISDRLSHGHPWKTVISHDSQDFPIKTFRTRGLGIWLAQCEVLSSIPNTAKQNHFTQRRWFSNCARVGSPGHQSKLGKQFSGAVGPTLSASPCSSSWLRLWVSVGSCCGPCHDCASLQGWLRSSGVDLTAAHFPWL